MKIICFHTETEPCFFLSNWYKAAFTVDGIRYSCSEQYMMERKAALFGDTDMAARILAETDPEIMQALGKKVKGFNAKIWDGYKQLVVYKGVYAKFSQNPELKEKLLATGDALLAEGARGDKAWGVGLHGNDPGFDDMKNWKGQNLLGFTLMYVRDELRQES